MPEFHEGARAYRRSATRFDCAECRAKTPASFVVNNALWVEHAGADRDRVLCLDCFENRLGRRVTFSDLKPCGVTDEYLLGLRIFWHGSFQEWKTVLDLVLSKEVVRGSQG